MAKSLFKAKSAYSSCYDDFRGVDFSSDHTQINNHRFAYAVNMYRDYRSGQGKAIETFPGFRRIFESPDGSAIYGIHEYSGPGGKVKFFHAGRGLYRFLGEKEPVEVAASLEDVYVSSSYAYSKLLDADGNPLTIPETAQVLSYESSGTSYLSYVQTVPLGNGMKEVRVNYRWAPNLGNIVYLEPSFAAVSESIMNERESCSFMANGRLYILDGASFFVYDGTELKKVYEDNPYVPTEYADIYADTDKLAHDFFFEQRNLLSDKVKNTFAVRESSDTEATEGAEGSATVVFPSFMPYSEGEVGEVRVYGEMQTAGTDYEVLETGEVSFLRALPTAVEAGYPEGYSGVEITLIKQPTFTLSDGTKISGKEVICGCTLVAEFDGRVFLSGNPALPNHVFYCKRNGTGYVDPSYFGELDYFQVGIGADRITALVSVADTLCILKSDTSQGGAVYYYTGVDGDSLIPRYYVGEKGLNGLGCLGAAVNFLDDPVFVSRLGLEGIGTLSAKYERAIEHRSSLVDAELLKCDLSKARLAEWEGYLVLLCEGKIFLADSRQRFTHQTGVMQYEWYYLEDIGVFKNNFPEYVFSERLREELVGATVGSHELEIASAVYDEVTDEYVNLTGTTANAKAWNEAEGRYDYSGLTVTAEVFNFTDEESGQAYSITAQYTVLDGRYYAVRDTGRKVGNGFYPAKIIRSLDSNLFFGTDNGVVCMFNFDKRDGATLEIPSRYYDFDGHLIRSGIATKMDNCGIPHLTKSTVRKSTVIKTKTLPSTSVKVKVRTNKEPYRQIARLGSAALNFGEICFDDLYFTTTEQTLFAVPEKEKRWVEKQYYIFSDDFRRPFALFYIASRYTVAGRYKE